MNLVGEARGGGSNGEEGVSDGGAGAGFFGWELYAARHDGIPSSKGAMSMPHSMERPCRRREPISRMSSTIILVVCTKPEKDYTSTRVSRYSVQEIEYSE